MVLFLLPLIVVVIIILKFGLLIGADAVKYKKNQALNANPSEAKERWLERINKLGINPDDCIDVLFYDNDKMISGQHHLLWYDGTKVRWILTPETIGKGIPSDPGHWQIFSYHIGEIIDVQKRQDCCIFSLSFMHYYCDVNDYDKLNEFIHRVKPS